MLHKSNIYMMQYSIVKIYYYFCHHQTDLAYILMSVIMLYIPESISLFHCFCFPLFYISMDLIWVSIVKEDRVLISV